MTCGGCTSKVTHALKAISGVGDVKVSLPTGEATVQYDERRASLEQLKSAVKSALLSLGLPHRLVSRKVGAETDAR